MSWLEEFTNPNSESQQRKKFVDNGPKVKDTSGRMVSTKTANQPFLKHKEWREKEEARKAAKARRKKERQEKLARGEAVGPEESDDEEEREIGCLGLLKFLASVVVILLLGSKFITGDWLWEYRGKWTNINTYLPSDQRLFSEATLAKFDGSNPDLPIYIAIDSTVYDVTAGKRIYGKGGSYNHMAGSDSTRAYGTGCFQTHRTHDLRGLTEAELNGIKHWIQFFTDHPTYHKVGRVIHPPIDLDSAPPPHCNPPPPDTAEAPEPTAAANVQREEL